MGKLKHGHARRGAKTKTYKVWESMHRRCYMPSQDSYPLYGGRGIKVVERWHDYKAFHADMGDCPPGNSLDRLDNDRHYEPGNCRWVPQAAQGGNKRNNHLISYNGETHTLSEWANRLGIKWKTLRARLEDYKWPVEKAFTHGLIRGRPRA